jgi:hypothetical protein
MHDGWATVASSPPPSLILSERSIRVRWSAIATTKVCSSRKCLSSSRSLAPRTREPFTRAAGFLALSVKPRTGMPAACAVSKTTRPAAPAPTMTRPQLVMAIDVPPKRLLIAWRSRRPMANGLTDRSAGEGAGRCVARREASKRAESVDTMRESRFADGRLRRQKIPAERRTVASGRNGRRREASSRSERDAANAGPIRRGPAKRKTPPRRGWRSSQREAATRTCGLPFTHHRIEILTAIIRP